MADDRPDWEPVAIESKNVLSASRGLAKISWKLSGGYNREWTELFEGDGRRSGSLGYVHGNHGEPQAYSGGGTIVREVPEGDLADAHNYVTRAVPLTNRRFEALQQQKATQAAQLREKRMADDAHRDELQRKLDDLE